MVVDIYNTKNKYNIIYADPPWKYHTWRDGTGTAEKHYKTMKVEDKIIENTYNKFRKVLPLWYDFIEISFLPNQMKIDYKALIEHRSSILNK